MTDRLRSPLTVAGLMAQAYALERESQQRYLEFAEIMEAHNNAEVAAVFRSIAAHEQAHAEQIRTRMGWDIPPAVNARPALVPPAFEQAHYLMQPWHVLQLALAAERRAQDFFASLIDACHEPQLREAATHLRDDERDHIALLEGWLARVPEPEAGWDDDPDPPRYTD